MPKTGIRSYETKTKGLRWLAYYHRDGRQMLRRGFRTARQAGQWRADAMINSTSPADSRVTVGEWMAEWLQRHGRNIQPSTYTRYEGVIRNWIENRLGTIRLAALTHRHIEAFHQDAMDKGMSPSSIRQHHAPLRLALREAQRDGLITSSPAELVRLPPLNQKEIAPFTPAEAQAFLAGNRHDELYPIYHLALSTGLRVGEIVALRVGRDIDLQTGSVMVREKRWENTFGPPKSRQSRRRVSLPQAAVEVLAEAIRGRKDGELAFPLRPGSVSHSITAACERAGVKRVRFHDLRHTHATHLLAAGANLKAVSARLGHSSPAFTLQVYGHVMPGMDEQLADMTEVTLSKVYHGTAAIMSQKRL